jgi:hypothetical protein
MAVVEYMDQAVTLTTSRRDFVSGVALFLCGAPSLMAAQDFWNRKSHDQWSSEEVRQLTTKSPWAKDARVELKAAGRGGYDGRAGRTDDPTAIPGGDAQQGGIATGRSMPSIDSGIGAGGIGPDPSGRMGGPGMPDRMGAGDRRSGGGIPMEALTATVRWESAQPVMEALRTTMPAEFAEHYVIGVSGLPALEGRAFAKGDEGMVERLKGSAVLQVKKKDPVQPGVVRRSASGLWFGFAKEFLALTAADREVAFNLNTGQFEVKVRFDLKDMTYQGKLAL